MTEINWNYWGTGSEDDDLKLPEITGAQALGIEIWSRGIKAP